MIPIFHSAADCQAQEAIGAIGTEEGLGRLLDPGQRGLPVKEYREDGHAFKTMAWQP